MKHLFCVVKIILCDCVNCTNTVDEMFEKKVRFWWSVVILALRVLKMYTLLVKIVPKWIKKTVKLQIKLSIQTSSY